MKELRTQHRGRPLRAFYAFDPRRLAILLIGGDKTADGRFYQRIDSMTNTCRNYAKKADLMARNFRELEAAMGPARVGRVKLRAREMMAEMLLSEIRKEAGVSQKQLAKTLDIRQPTLSRMESQEDMQISTLRRIILAGGATGNHRSLAQGGCDTATVSFKTPAAGGGLISPGRQAAAIGLAIGSALIGRIALQGRLRAAMRGW
jgi:DNA-binding XRE family transcriptional regulator